jgi:hypothetical protein
MMVGTAIRWAILVALCLTAIATAMVGQLDMGHLAMAR